MHDHIKKALQRGAFFVVLYCVSVLATADSVTGCVSDRLDEPVRVEQVVDGDTLRLADHRLVRLIGINTPEIGRRGEPSEVMAEEARHYLQNLLGNRNTVSLQPGIESRDRYGRVLAHAFLPDGRNVQAALLEAGMGAWILVPPNKGFAACYRRAETLARNTERGVWRSIYRPIEVDELSRDEEGFRIIQGQIDTVGQGRFTLWPNFTRLPGEAPREGVTLRIQRRHLDQFTHWSPEDLAGQRVEARGWLYRDGRQLVMNVRHPDAVRLLLP